MVYIATIFAVVEMWRAGEWRMGRQWMEFVKSWVRFSYAESFAETSAAAGAESSASATTPAVWRRLAESDV